MLKYDHLQLRQVFSSLDNFRYRDKWWVIDIGGKNSDNGQKALIRSIRVASSWAKSSVWAERPGMPPRVRIIDSSLAP